jgi:hypothetical protein
VVCNFNFPSALEQSRRDDLESLGYVLIYFLKGSLPWQGLKAGTKKAKYERILERKMATSTEALAKGQPGTLCLSVCFFTPLADHNSFTFPTHSRVPLLL